ncbi:MAG: endoribonuclease MazF [Oligoflexales bacterium]|nr:endoribonuclease MazF [Oligoflexales bacterium]
MKKYIPAKGDIILVSFDPRSGKEQSGFRPAITLSPKKYNEIVGLAIVCPITSQIKGYPFEVKLEKLKTQGVVLTDQIRNIDWKFRKIKFVENAECPILNKVFAKLRILLEF